jgi:5-methylcytosine-specific restriction enzyme B
MADLTIREALEEILSRYANARGTEQFAGNALRDTFENIKKALQASEALCKRRNLRVRWSMGQGNWAKIPWIAFLDAEETTQHGVYCVYLFRQDMSGVYLTYNQGVTRLIQESGRAAAYNELRQRAASIRESCQKLLGKDFSVQNTIDLKADPGLGADYEPSTIAYKLYVAGAVPEDSILLDDLETLLETYDYYLEQSKKATPTMSNTHDRRKEESLHASLAQAFYSHSNSEKVKLLISDQSANRLIASILSKRFLILAGLAGSGKTKIAQAFARWITPDPGWIDDADPSKGKNPNPHYALVPVGADWTGNENIIGYPNGLDIATYITKPALELMRHALDPAHAAIPHFLILDEMNLSHVERYFADILSAIESGEEIPLYEGGERTVNDVPVPSRLRLPENLFIIGTVNVDETTYMFSPKVLDRANVIEFRLEPDELQSFLEAPKAPRLEELDGKGSKFGAGFVQAASDKGRDVPAAVKESFEREMLLFFNLLREHNAEYGYRTGYEAARFIHFFGLLGGYPDGSFDWFESAMDAVIAQKFLPKLHGSRSKLEGLLWALGWACGAERAERDARSFAAQIQEASQAQDEALYGPETLWGTLARANPGNPAAAARYPLSYAKVMRMWRKLVRDQFVTFAEA